MIKFLYPNKGDLREGQQVGEECLHKLLVFSGKSVGGYILNFYYYLRILRTENNSQACC